MSEKYLIFGATGSIGSSLAEQLVNSGNSVHLVGRNETETKNISERLGCTFTIADVLEDGFIEKVKNDISDIKGVAYCVGSIDLKPLRMVNENDFNKCMKLNLYSAVEVIKGYQESLKKNKGSVVLFSTVAAQRGFTNHAIIASAKAAVEGLTVSLAAEFAPNIRVNCIAPSLTNSKIAEPMLKNKALADGIAKAHPLKRLGEGKDSASLAKFLITDDSSWVTGQIIAVDGGRSIDPTQYAIPFTSEISFLTLSTNPSCKTSAIVNVQPNFSEIFFVSVSPLPTKWTEFPEFTNCSAKLEPMDPVAPKIRYFSDIKNLISYI